MMIEVLKFIDEKKIKTLRYVVRNPADSLDSIQNDIANGYITALDDIKEFIQSEQKVINITQVVDTHLIHDIVDKNRGDVIRESNESLAKLFAGIETCCDFCTAYPEACNNKCENNILKYLNRKAEEGDNVQDK